MNEPPGPRSRGCLSGLTVAERFREAEGLWRMTLLVSIGSGIPTPTAWNTLSKPKH
ncbi:hypothetical protein NC652_027651 [Populus alba x Populus x berolinensis]|nr:hypothetical protein NC652_027651 [Populus alba x Populus x berolinensis]